MKLCNQLGISLSVDTHNLYVTEIAESSVNEPFGIPSQKYYFTVAGVDYFNMLQSHAAIYCGDQSHSYHVTTIQIIQPNPIPVNAGASATPKHTTIVLSLASSPHNWVKLER